MGRPRLAVPTVKLTTAVNALLLAEIKQAINYESHVKNQGALQAFFEAASRHYLSHLGAAAVARRGPAATVDCVAKADKMCRQSKKRAARLQKILTSLETYVAEERRSIADYEG